MSDKYMVHIDIPIKKGTLIDEIKSFTDSSAKIRKMQPKKKEKIVDDGFMMSSIGSKKKDKTKKKKSKELDLEFMTSGEVSTVSTMDDNENFTPLSDDNLIDMDEIFYRDDEEESIGEGIIGEQRNNYSNLKRQENVYKKEFAEELTLLYNLLDEVNKFGKDLEKKYKIMDSSRARGMSKYSNDMIINILQSKTSKLHIMKEIANIKKVVADLKIKEDGKNKADGSQGPQSTEYLAASYFQNVLKYGRNNFITGITNGGEADSYDDIVSKIEDRKTGYNEDEIDDLQDLIDERLDSDDNPFRTESGSKYIEHENLGVKIQIKKCIDTGEWEFIAVDRDGQQVFDYPLPKRKDVGKIKFSSDGKYASDERGRSYGVFEYYSAIDDED